MVQPSFHQRSDLKEIARRAMVDRGLQPDFAPPVKAELDRITGAAPPAGQGIRDLRGLLWCSIDNDDSKDLDQLSVSESLPGGAVKILVAVADVDAVVKKDMAIDQHARHNTTSVYTAAEIFPMLPPRLSTDVTSLNEGEDRLALVVELAVAPDGSLDGSSVYRAAVKNRAQLAYDAVSAWIEGKAPAPEPVSRVAGLDEQLRVQDAVAQKLRGLRFEQGALDLETLQPKAIFDGETVVALRQEPHNRARQLIEDFMIAANGVTARFLAERKFSSLRRVVRSPERWQRIVEVAKEQGEHLPPEPDSKAL
ncbi:MAG TPA: ribonuclease catalytic domain-containing protein, partial [Thermoanaerobaculia bacterium]|nr:ribonuclease catalytic domain-containing protein [Thermoanaerobaculia bacterium]